MEIKVVNQARKLRDFLLQFSSGYITAKRETFAGHSMGNLVRNEIPSEINNSGIVNPEQYLVKGSVGQGNWVTIPWICIFDRSVTETAQKGVYIVYLLSEDGKELFLTFNQGCTEISRNHSKQETVQILHNVANEIREKIDNYGFEEGTISLGKNLSGLGYYYGEGTIFYKKYLVDNLPSASEVEDDLRKMVKIYGDYVSYINAGNNLENQAFLFTYNPAQFGWVNYKEDVKKTHNGSLVREPWATNTTQVKIGDTAYLMMLGNVVQRGIIAKGTIVSEIYETDHWKPEKAAEGKKVKKVDIDWDWLIDPENEEILLQSELKEKFPNQQWSPQGTGIAIKNEYTEELLNLWLKTIGKGGEPEMSVKDTVEAIKSYIAAQGFTYPEGMIENFYLSLKSKPFVLLAGTSGTGKSKLVELFTKAIGIKSVGEDSVNGRYLLESVRPDWSDSSDLLGYKDLQGNFVEKNIAKFIYRAMNDTDKPYFLCLDEMNLARVEYYFSDFLSKMETRHTDIKSGRLVSDTLAEVKVTGADGNQTTVDLVWPENLYVVGTVNMDETTFPFSKKVLDRANTIEFKIDTKEYTGEEVNKNAFYLDFDRVSSEAEEVEADNGFLKTRFMNLLRDCPEEEQDKAKEVSDELGLINKILSGADLEFGYRVRDEITFYIINADKDGVLKYSEAMDNCIMQKILPRIQGSGKDVKKALEDLKTHCSTKSYANSLDKINFMLDRYEADSYTSYWR